MALSPLCSESVLIKIKMFRQLLSVHRDGGTEEGTRPLAGAQRVSAEPGCAQQTVTPQLLHLGWEVGGCRGRAGWTD
jgi:hypothetical protein